MKIIILFLLIISNVYAQEKSIVADKMLDKIYLQDQQQEKLRSSLGNYKFRQFIHFIKFDGDGEMDEQSKREYILYVKSESQRKRELISALEYDDGKWTDITEKRKNKQVKSEHHSESFSLAEMFSPENRKLYNFENIGEEMLDTLQTVHIKAISKEEDEDLFQGHLWFDMNKFNLVKADLAPSEMPTFVDNMRMLFEMQNVDSLWLPQKIYFEAEIDILFLFGGNIQSEITFSDFEFNQQFEEDWFNKLENAD